MSKLSLFRPDAIRETHFFPGRHVAAPTGDVAYPDRDEVLLLHYKYLGFDRVSQRQAMLATGLGPDDVRSGFGEHYAWDDAKLRRRWDGFASQSVDVTQIADPNAEHREARWWRPRGAKEWLAARTRRWRPRRAPAARR